MDLASLRMAVSGKFSRFFYDRVGYAGFLDNPGKHGAKHYQHDRGVQAKSPLHHNITEPVKERDACDKCDPPRHKGESQKCRQDPRHHKGGKENKPAQK